MVKGLIKVIKKAKSGSVWVSQLGEDPYEIEYFNRSNIKIVNS